MNRTTLRRGLGATALSTMLMPGMPALGAGSVADDLRLPEPTAVGSRQSYSTQPEVPDPLTVEDVTAANRALVNDLVRGAAEDGVEMDPATVRVVHPMGSPEDLYVLPDRATLVSASDGGVEVAISPAPASEWSRSKAPRSAAFWKMIDQDCFDFFEHGGVKMRTCWWDNVLMNDPDSAKTWRSLQLKATASPAPHLIKRAEITGRTMHPHGKWSDWSPGSDYNGNCQNTTVSVSAFGLSVGQDSQRCEIWDITLGDNPQWGLKNAYKYNGSLAGSPNDREVALAIAITVPQSSTHQGWFVIQGLEGA